MYSTEQLLAKIECLRKKMIKVASKNGLTNKESVAISQELDKLLTRYQNEMRNEKAKDK